MNLNGFDHFWQQAVDVMWGLPLVFLVAATALHFAFLCLEPGYGGQHYRYGVCIDGHSDTHGDNIACAEGCGRDAPLFQGVRMKL